MNTEFRIYRYSSQILFVNVHITPGKNLKMKKGGEEDTTQTIDNLCKRDKNKVIELLKQLNELRKRCSFLESKIEAQSHENERIEGRNEMIAQQIDATEKKFSEASEVSKDSPKQLEELTLNIQTSEIENSNLRLKIEDSEREIKSLKDNLQELKTKYDRIYLDASVSCIAKCFDKSITTDDVSQNHANKEVQAPEKRVQMDYLYDDSQTNLGESFSVYYSQPDDDINNLISILNHID